MKSQNHSKRITLAEFSARVDIAVKPIAFGFLFF